MIDYFYVSNGIYSLPRGMTVQYFMMIVIYTPYR